MSDMSTVDEKDVQRLEEHIGQNPDSILFARLADAYLSNERVEDAIRLCEDGIKKYPYYTTGHFVLGKGYMADKQFEQAEKEFKRVLLFDPKYLAAHKRYGDLMREIGWENTCETSYKKILEIDPLDDVARSIAGEYVLQGSETDDESQAQPDVVATDVSAPPDAPEYDSPDVLAAEMADSSDATVQQADIDPAENTATPAAEQSDEPVTQPEVTDSPGISASGSEQFREEDLDFGDLGPLPVSQEEEALMFETTDTDNETTEEEPSKPLPDLQDSETDEFSYLLDDIFKDEIVDDKPRDRRTAAPDDAIDDLLAAPDNGDSYSIDDDTSQATDERVTKVEKPVSPKRNMAEPVSMRESELAPAGVTQASTERKNAPVRTKKTASEKIVTPTLGEIYFAQGQYGKAIDVFETLLKKYPENEVYLKKISQLKQKLAESKHAS
jgi:tetratricopeptide (TPR) repeat protein